MSQAAPPMPAINRWWNPIRWPLPLQIAAAVVLGALLGRWRGTDPLVAGLPAFTTADLGELASLVFRMLTTLAIPLIFFAILDAFLKTEITGRLGLRFLAICVINLAAALTLGLTIMNLFQPGLAWQNRLDEMAARINVEPAKITAGAAAPSLSPLKNLDGYIPKSFVAPFAESNVIGVVLLAVLLGIAFRRVRDLQRAQGRMEAVAAEALIETTYEALMAALGMIVRILPLAMFAAMANVVGRFGFDAITMLGRFLLFIGLGLALHALVYYPLSAWIGGGRSPREYLKSGLDAIVTGFSANSSLAAVPVTLRCLTERLRVSEASARLSACIGTNFNNDGITLYEAMAVLFISQAIGTSPTLGSQITLVLASLMASVGIAGIPASGLIVLPLVLRTVGINEATIAIVFPLIASLDWILARVRSAVNVLGDMQVAILLDGHPAADEPAKG